VRASSAVIAGVFFLSLGDVAKVDPSASCVEAADEPANSAKGEILLGRRMKNDLHPLSAFPQSDAQARSWQYLANGRLGV
jgi:hypothetical protein